MRVVQSKVWQGRLALLVFAALLGIFTIPATAQVLYTTIVGTVEDATGALVPNAKVTISDSATGVNREATTDSAGNYTIPSVPIGTYVVKITANRGARA